MKRPTGSTWLYGLLGLVSAIAGVAVGHFVAALVEPAASPVLAIGSQVIDATPTPVKEWAVSNFGTADKPILLASVSLVTAAAAAAIGILWRRRAQLAVVLIMVLAMIAGVAAALRPAAGQAAIFPAVATAIVGAAVLTFLGRRLRDSEPASPNALLASSDETDSEPAESPLDHTAYAPGVPGRPQRRSFLVGAGALVAGSAGLGAVGQRLAGTSGTLPDNLTLPAPTTNAPALPAELNVSGISPLKTPIKDFYRVDTALIVPKIDASTWELQIDGDVDNPFTLTYADLLKLPLVESNITLNCVSNEIGGPYIGSTVWLGALVKPLLERAGVRDGVDQILSTSTDGMTISTPLSALTDDRGAMLAIAMDGMPLTPEHGFPVRLLTPGLYGFIGATKWVTKLTATTYAKKEAYWTERGWATEDPVRTQARIDTPGGLSTSKAGPVPIAGVAWSQANGGISKVEVQIDDGPWNEATLGEEANDAYWRQWSYIWPATTGRHTLTVRATDGHGELQTTQLAKPFPAGATGLHSIVVQVA